jgi:phosphopantothenoylcysteine synthetase/decarboxylase
VANDVTSGVFGSDSATVHILNHDGRIVTLQDQSKHLIADRLLDMALSMYRARKPTS